MLLKQDRVPFAVLASILKRISDSRESGSDAFGTSNVLALSCVTDTFTSTRVGAL